MSVKHSVANYLKVGDPAFAIRRRSMVAALSTTIVLMFMAACGITDVDLGKTIISSGFVALIGIPAAYGFVVAASTIADKIGPGGVNG